MYIDLFMDILAVRLAWASWRPVAVADKKDPGSALGHAPNRHRGSSPRLRRSPSPTPSEQYGLGSQRRRRAASPGPPRCADGLPAHRAALASHRAEKIRFEQGREELLVSSSTRRRPDAAARSASPTRGSSRARTPEPMRTLRGNHASTEAMRTARTPRGDSWQHPPSDVYSGGWDGSARGVNGTYSGWEQARRPPDGYGGLASAEPLEEAELLHALQQAESRGVVSNYPVDRAAGWLATPEHVRGFEAETLRQTSAENQVPVGNGHSERASARLVLPASKPLESTVSLSQLASSARTTNYRAMDEEMSKQPVTGSARASGRHASDDEVVRLEVARLLAAGRSPEFIAGYLARFEEVTTTPDIRQGAVLFEVDLDLGGGQVVPIQMREGVDAETVAYDLARMHSLSDAQERHIARYLRLMTRNVTLDPTQGSLSSVR